MRLIGTAHRMLQGHQIKKDEMGWACGTYWETEMHIDFWWRKKKAARMT